VIDFYCDQSPVAHRKLNRILHKSRERDHVDLTYKHRRSHEFV